MKDALGDRMKGQYERRAAAFLPRRTYTVIRLDGKAFHTYTRGLTRPYDQQLMDDMAATTKYLCEQVQGVSFGYAQSDEVSLLLTDFASPGTQAWFDGNVQKIVSISASFATAKFNELRPGKLAVFDSRVFTIPDPVEVANYFVWRQKDATRNSISMAAQAKFSAKQLHGKSTGEMQDMLWREHQINWDDYDPRFKRGTVVLSKEIVSDVEYLDKRDGEWHIEKDVKRRAWCIEAAPLFTRPVAAKKLIPALPAILT